MKKVKESVGTHVGKAYDNWITAEDREDDEIETINIANKSGGDIIKMQLLDEYLIFMQEQEEGFIQEVPAALAGIVGAAQTAAPVVSALYGVMYAIKGANWVYKNTMNKAHKACRGLDKKTYTNCVRKYKLQAYQEQIKAMTKALPTCKKDKNPEKCQAKIKEKIKGIQLRIQSLKQAIAREKEMHMAKAKAAGEKAVQKQQGA
jgi:hypothetical protein